MARAKNSGDGAIGLPKPARTSKKSNGTVEQFNDQDAIARRAYEIFQKRGGNHGADLDDWLEAERQLRPGPGGVTGPAPAKPRRRKSSA